MQYLGRLKTDLRRLEAWTERLREWLASDLLQPLVRQMEGVHKASLCNTVLFSNADNDSIHSLYGIMKKNADNGIIHSLYGIMTAIVMLYAQRAA